MSERGLIVPEIATRAPKEENMFLLDLEIITQKMIRRATKVLYTSSTDAIRRVIFEVMQASPVKNHPKEIQELLFHLEYILDTGERFSHSCPIVVEKYDGILWMKYNGESDFYGTNHMSINFTIEELRVF